jgi:hypothetical protein
MTSINSENARELGALGNATQGKRNRHPDLSQATTIRQLTYSALQQPDLSPGDLSRLVHAWDKIQERIRILRGKPLPGFLRPEKVGKKKVAPAMRSEPTIASLDDISATDSVVNE